MRAVAISSFEVAFMQQPCHELPANGGGEFAENRLFNTGHLTHRNKTTACAAKDNFNPLICLEKMVPLR